MKLTVSNGGAKQTYTIQVHVMDWTEMYVNGVHYQVIHHAQPWELPVGFQYGYLEWNKK